MLRLLDSCQRGSPRPSAPETRAGRDGQFGGKGCTKGFVSPPRRWVVDWVSWFGRNRRLANDFENTAET
jgi:hypothetical protein